VIDHFTNLRYLEVKLDLVLGDDTILRGARHGIFSFQRELMTPLVLRDVLYVHGLKKTMVSISSI